MMKYLLSIVLLFSLLHTKEIYFDTPDFYLLNNNAVLKYQITDNQETIVYESFSKKKHTFKVKHYRKVKSIEEKHPLLSLVKRKDRASFINMLKDDGIKYPMKLKHIFTASIPVFTSAKNNINRYKKLHNIKSSGNLLFNLKFQYPYFTNLVSAILFSLVGLVFVFIFKK